MKPFSIFIFFITLFAAAAAVPTERAAADDGIGLVITAEGTVHARRDGTDIPLALKDRVFVSDTLITGPDSTLQILLDDDSSVTISSNSSVDMVEFSNDENDAKFSSHLTEGRMRVITGRTTERNPDGFKITTRHATIGIRGTILTLTSAQDFTKVDVNSTSLEVLVNGIPIPQFYEIVIRDGAEPEISPLPAEERMADGELAGEPVGGMAGTEDGGGLIAAVPSVELPLPISEPEPALPLDPEPILPIPDPIQYPWDINPGDWVLLPSGDVWAKPAGGLGWYQREDGSWYETDVTWMHDGTGWLAMSPAPPPANP